MPYKQRKSVAEGPSAEWYTPRKYVPPRDDVEKCPCCGKYYGFIACRITKADKSNVCASCYVGEHRSEDCAV